MNRDFEKRMLIVFVVLFGMTGAMMFLMPKPQGSKLPETVQTNAAVAEPVRTIADAAVSQVISNAVFVSEKVAPTNILISWSNETIAEIDSYGGSIRAYSASGKWNRSKTPVSLVATNAAYRPGDLFFGKTENIAAITDRPVYAVEEATSASATLSAKVTWQGTPVVITKRYVMSSNYLMNLTVTFSNAGNEAVKIDSDGRSFAVGAGFSFFTKETMAQGNMLYVNTYDGRNFQKVLQGGLLQARPHVSIVTNPQWISMQDYYFLGVLRPRSGDVFGKALLLSEVKSYSEVAMGLEYLPFALSKGEAKSFSLDIYGGPKKESISTKAIKSLSKLFEWPVVFNWFMKPIEWFLQWGMNVLSFIPNYGIIIILMALVIKLLLMPLSVQAAVSVKRMNLLQPKLKNLQEKYKDNQTELNQKLAELYKKEGVNPLGGCLPMLLQIPVFFALFRVLSTSVELRGASFLWMKDLTQPDTLFSVANMPILGNFHFNLMPILMTTLQLIQSLLQMQKNPTQGNQAMVNAILMPVLFLFFFYGMPSGLVVYWTIQTIYTIFEQEIVNFDRKVMLK
jgi:YidC/Oxa1 family membrane protein insertase